MQTGFNVPQPQPQTEPQPEPEPQPITMKYTLKIFLLLSAALFLSSCESSTGSRGFSDAHEVNNRLGRGINMGNTFEAPSETAWDNPWDPDYFSIMKDIGFSHVRIPVRWTTDNRSADEPPYTISSEFFSRIQKAVDTALENELHVIINMHHHEEIFSDPMVERERFMSQWDQIADFFQHYPDSLIFEILNEPHDNLTAEIWNSFLHEALEIIRKNNPERVVMIGTADWGGLSALSELQWPEDDSQLILTLHYYNPFQFTHQGAEWTGDFTQNWLGTQWKGTQQEMDAVKEEFERVFEFADYYDVPVNIGEFGAIRYADIESRVRWTYFLSRWFEKQNFSWTYWEFSAYHFGIYNPETREFNVPLKDALLDDLKTPSRD